MVYTCAIINLMMLIFLIVDKMLIGNENEYDFYMSIVTVSSLNMFHIVLLLSFNDELSKINQIFKFDVIYCIFSLVNTCISAYMFYNMIVYMLNDVLYNYTSCPPNDIFYSKLGVCMYITYICIIIMFIPMLPLLNHYFIDT
jgi:hypothetical protein